MDFAVAFLITLALATVVATIEVKHGSQQPVRLTGWFVIYSSLSCFVATVVILLLGPTLRARFPGRDSIVVDVVLGLVGVGGTQAFGRTLGLTFGGKDVLAFDKWVTRARDHAIASQNEAAAAFDAREDARLARRLATSPRLDTIVLKILGDGARAKHEARATKNNADPNETKALAAVQADRDAVAALLGD